MTTQDIQFTIDMSFKAEPMETEHDGERGLFIEGYATRFGVVDKQDEWTDSQSFTTAARTFFKSDSNGAVPLLYEHGFDPVLSTTRLGRIVNHKVDDVGLWIKGWIPRPQDVADDIGQKALQVYEAVKSGAINALSVGGCFGKIGRKIARVGLYEISLTDRPVLPSATFAVAKKSLPAVDAVIADGGGTQIFANPLEDPDAFISAFQTFVSDMALGQKAWPKGKQMPPWLGEKVDKGRANDGQDGPRHADTVQHGLSREGHAQAMKVAQRDKSVALHDHLLDPANHAPEAQSAHDPETCPICQNRRDQQGIKAQSSPAPGGEPSEGHKALSPEQLPHHMTELAALALELAQLHALSSAEDGERAELEPGVKAGRAISGLSLQTLRAFASQVVAAGQALHQWLDTNQPDPTPLENPAAPTGGAPPQKKKAAMAAATGKS